MSGRSVRNSEGGAAPSLEDDKRRDLKTAKFTGNYMREAFSFFPVHPVGDVESEKDFDLFAALNSKVIDWLKKENVHGGNAKSPGQYANMSIAAHQIAESMFNEYGDKSEPSVFTSLAAYETLAFGCLFAAMGKFGKFVDEKKKARK
jgi:hypothetical protein